MNATPDTTAPRISWQISLLLFLAVLLLAVPQAAMLPLIDRDEPRFAEAAREMIQGGNFIVPHFNSVPRYDKPPLIYWCQAAAYVIFGQNAFAARLPSLLATAATAVLIYTWGVRLGRGWIGLAAALSYAFCLQTMQQGRVATADALLIFFMTLAAFAGWLIVKPKSGGRAPFACHAVLALAFAGGFLAKGPEAWLPLIAILACARGQRLAVTLSFIAGLAIMLAWGVPAYINTHGDYLWQSWKAGIADRAWGSDQGHGASSIGIYLLELPYYLIGFWISALPWSVLIAINARRLFSGWKLDLADRYLLLNIVPLWIVFTLMATKLPHYTLPTFPMLALLFTRRWVAAQLSPKLPIRLATGFGVTFALLAIIGVPLAVENGYSPSPAGKLVFLAGDNLKPDTQFALVDFKEPTAVWEMRRVSTGFAQLIDSTRIHDFLDSKGPHAVILTTHEWNDLRMAHPDTWRAFQAQGINAAKIKVRAPYYLPTPDPLDLTLIAKP